MSNHNGYIIQILVIILLFIYSNRFFIYKAKSILSHFPYFMGMSLSEKYKYRDGDFFQFVEICKKIIPAGERVTFYNPIEFYLKNKYYDPSFFYAYHRRKAVYYLYPIRVYSDYFYKGVVSLGDNRRILKYFYPLKEVNR